MGSPNKGKVDLPIVEGDGGLFRAYNPPEVIEKEAQKQKDAKNRGGAVALTVVRGKGKGEKTTTVLKRKKGQVIARVSSFKPLATQRPSGAIARAVTGTAYSQIVRSAVPCGCAQRRTVLS